MRPQDVERAHHANRSAWNRNAEFWDERTPDGGNDFARHLVLPPSEAPEVKTGAGILSWSGRFHDIPAVLVGRLRPGPR